MSTACGQMASGPLDGVRVIELGSLIAGPFAGRMLADFGADVIKVELPGQEDPARVWGQEPYRGHRLYWPVLARNKRCITLDIRTEQGREVLLDLVRCSDVVVENFRPGRLEAWGLGFEELTAVNPGIILARVSGYGQDGPHAQKPGYASVAEAVSGLRALNGFPGGPPPRTAISLGDSLGGLFAFQGVLAALYHRQRSGRGQVVDAALTEACLAMLESTVPEYDRLGRVRQPGGTRLDGVAPSNIFRSRDGHWVLVAANQDSLFRRLAGALGRPELAVDERFATHEARGAHQDELDDLIQEWVGARDAAEVVDLLERAEVVVGRVNTAADLVEDVQLRARGALVAHHDERLGEDVLGPGIAPRLSLTPGAVRWAGPPRAGTHNEEVFLDLLEMTADQVTSLEAAGVV